MKKKWSLKNSRKISERIFPELERATEKLLVKKGINNRQKQQEFLYPDYERDLHNPRLLGDMDKAVRRILQARKGKEKVCIFGDYDVDGITSASILFDFFQQIGLESFVYLPDRNKEGYGLNKQAIDYIKQKGASLIITVDSGITSLDEVKYAQKKGLETIITDHHLPLEKVPPALAVINPKKKEDSYPEKMLAGVGVTFKLIQALAAKIEGYDQEQLKWLLDLVALGSVADCVPLLGENRTLTKFGLIVLAKTRRTGLKQLFQVGRINIGADNLPTGEQISYQIAPRLNAAGRMDHASLAYELLKCPVKESARARLLALEIEEQNQQRQKTTSAIIKEIENKLDKNNLPAVIIDSSPHWSLGVVGLVAGRLAEKYHRPVILFQEQHEYLKGSCRSVPGFNLVENLKQLAHLLEKFGGHAQAAGLTILRENLPTFRQKFAKIVSQANLSLAEKEVIIDEELALSEINEKLLKELSLFEPFGIGNEKPLFLSRKVKIEQIKYLGKQGQHLKIWVSQNGNQQQILPLIMFNFSEKTLNQREAEDLQPGGEIDIVYTLQKNFWNGQVSIEGQLVDLRKVNNK